MNNFLILILSMVSFTIHSQGLVINELMADNEATFSVENNAYHDWIEILNTSDVEIQLANYFLSDDLDNLLKWQFPSYLLSPKEIIVLFASGKNQNNLYWHTNFKISSEGEKIYLSDLSGNIIQIGPNVEMEEDVSWGLYNSLDFYKQDTPTPGQANLQLDNILEFSHEDGCYKEGFSLQVHSLTGDSIFYTSDCSDPKPNDQFYEGIISLESTLNLPYKIALIPSTPAQDEISFKAWELPSTNMHQFHTLRFRSYKDGLPTSQVYTKEYFVGGMLTDLIEFPVISLVSDSINFYDINKGFYLPGNFFDSADPEWTGNYFQRGWEWEKPVHISYFDLNKLKFEQDMGFRIHGQKTRQASQKSFRFHAREKYGQSIIDYPLIKDSYQKQFNAFILRNVMGSWFGTSVFKDELIQSICKPLDFESMDSETCVVFLNGEYWGLYTIRDQIDENYIARKYNLDKNEIEEWDWTNSHYFNLKDYIAQNDLSESIHYDYVSTQMDLGSFIDYMIAQIFFQNVDWPEKNNQFWRPLTDDGKWRWIFFDLDGAIPSYKFNTIENATNGSDLNFTKLIYRSLLQNDIFKTRFVNRYLELLDAHFSAENMLGHFNARVEKYSAAVNLHIDRWNSPKNKNEWFDDIGMIREFIIERPCSARNEMIEYFGLNLSECEAPIIPDNIKFPTVISDKHIFDATTLANADEVLIHDSSAKLIYKNYKGFSNNINFELFPSGYYIITYITGDHSETSSFVIIR